MISTLFFVICQVREGGDIHFTYDIGWIQSHQEMIVVQRVLLNVAHIILCWAFSQLFCDFKARGLRSITTPPIAAFMEFFLPGAEKISTHYRYDEILSLARYDTIFLLAYNV